MKILTNLGAVAVAGTLIVSIGLSQAEAANPAPAPGATTPVTTAPGKKFSFTAADVNNARRISPAKPQIILSWETKVRLANDALAADGATLKKAVDDMLARVNQKSVDCSAKDYTPADLQNLCKPNEGAQACLDRLRMNCIIGQQAQQMENSIANAMGAATAKAAIDRMRNELTSLEKALFQQ